MNFFYTGNVKINFTFISQIYLVEIKMKIGTEKKY